MTYVDLYLMHSPMSPKRLEAWQVTRPPPSSSPSLTLPPPESPRPSPPPAPPPHPLAARFPRPHQAMLRLRDAKRCRAVGVSNFSELHLKELEDNGLELPAVNQARPGPAQLYPPTTSAHTLPCAHVLLAALPNRRAQGGAEGSGRKGGEGGAGPPVAARLPPSRAGGRSARPGSPSPVG